MVIIHCGMTLVDAPNMRKYWERFEHFTISIRSIEDIIHYNQGSEWNYDWYSNGYDLQETITRFRNKIRSIQRNLMSRRYVTRLIALTLRNCTELLGLVEEMNFRIINILDNYEMEDY